MRHDESNEVEMLRGILGPVRNSTSSITVTSKDQIKARKIKKKSQDKNNNR